MKQMRLFSAPIGTPMPNAKSSTGLPVSLTPDGVTEWVHMEGAEFATAVTIPRIIEEPECKHLMVNVTHDSGDRLYWTCRLCGWQGTEPLED